MNATARDNKLTVTSSALAKLAWTAAAVAFSIVGSVAVASWQVASVKTDVEHRLGSVEDAAKDFAAMRIRIERMDVNLERLVKRHDDEQARSKP